MYTTRKRTMDQNEISTRNSQSRSTSVKLRVATEDDLTRINGSGQRVWLWGKDFWATGSKGDTQYYRLNPENEMVTRFAKEGLKAGRILVVDVEGVEDEWSG